jgi:hypothetical protein
MGGSGEGELLFGSSMQGLLVEMQLMMGLHCWMRTL